MAIQSPFSVEVSTIGFSQVLPDILISNEEYQIFILQITNKKECEMKIYAGPHVGWHGNLPKNNVTTIDFRPLGWALHNGLGLVVETLTKNPSINVNVVSHTKIRST